MSTLRPQESYGLGFKHPWRANCQWLAERVGGTGCMNSKKLAAHRACPYCGGVADQAASRNIDIAGWRQVCRCSFDYCIFLRTFLQHWSTMLDLRPCQGRGRAEAFAKKVRFGSAASGPGPIVRMQSF